MSKRVNNNKNNKKTKLKKLARDIEDSRAEIKKGKVYDFEKVCTKLKI